MKIERILNNNVVITLDDNHEEQVVCGKGIGFGKKVGDNVSKDAINKTFILAHSNLSGDVQRLLNEIPLEYLQMAREIVDYARTFLNKQLSDNLLITLSDHIYNAVSRYNEGIVIKNSMFWEIKGFYKSEYNVGLFALELVSNRTGVKLPEDEAAFIALHIVNAGLENSGADEAYKITSIIRDVSNIIKRHFKIEYDTESAYYYRFITHLKFFAQRLIKNELFEEDDNELYQMIVDRYQDSYSVIPKIEKYMHEVYKYDMTKTEKMYLTIHIERIVKSARTKEKGSDE